MNRWYALSIAVGVALVASAKSGPLAAQNVTFAACQEACPDPLRFPLEAAACASRRDACNAKINLYNGYMSQLGSGAVLRQLPAAYAEILQTQYSGVNLNSWRFAFGSRQPPSNATTDCTVTYFNNPAFVEKLRAGNLDADWELGWLFHELRHVGQCQQIGGRERYAKMWFGHLEFAFLSSANLETLHDRMPMEADADSVADRVATAMARNRDRNGRLVKALSLTVRSGTATVGDQVTAYAGNPVRFAAVVSGGSDPIAVEWQIKLPGATAFRPVDITGLNFTLTPNQLGTYQVLARAFQDGSRLEPARKLMNIQVQPERRLLTERIEPSPVAGAAVSVQTTLTSTLSITVANTAGSPLQATVCAGDTANAARYGRRVAGRDGRVTFSVPRGMAVQVTAAMPGYIGLARSLTMANGDLGSTLSLRAGLGGAVCP